VPKLFGFEAGSGSFWERLYDILIHLDDALLTLAIGLPQLLYYSSWSTASTSYPQRSSSCCWGYSSPACSHSSC
jgi:hypothetical protein